MCARELALEHLLRLAFADERRVAAMLAVAADEADCHEVERDGCGKENPENDVPVRSRGFPVALDGVDKADVAAERFDFLLLHCGGAGGCRHECGFGRCVALLNLDGPGAERFGLVGPFGGVEPRVRNFRDFERALLFGVEEYLDALGCHDLAAGYLLVDAVFGRHGTEVVKAGQFRVGDGAGCSVAPDGDGECERFADLQVVFVEVCIKAVVAHHSREVCGPPLGRERLYADVHYGGGRFGLDGFLLHAPARERHVAHLFFLFDNLGLAAFGVLELERRNLEVAALGGAEPGEFRARLHFAAGTFDRLEFHVGEVAPVDDKVAAGVHVGGLEVPFEMFEGVEAKRDVELFPFVNAFLARGEAHGQGVVVVGTLHVDGNATADGLRFPVDCPDNLSHVNLSRPFGGPDLECVNARLVGPAAATEERFEHVVKTGTDDLVCTVEAHEGKAVLCL